MVKTKRKSPLNVTVKLSPRLSQLLNEWTEELGLTIEEVIIAVLEYLLENEDTLADIFPLEDFPLKEE